MLIFLNYFFYFIDHLLVCFLKVLFITNYFWIEYFFDVLHDFYLFLFPLLRTELFVTYFIISILNALFQSLNRLVFTNHDPCILDIRKYPLVKCIHITFCQLQKIIWWNLFVVYFLFENFWKNSMSYFNYVLLKLFSELTNLNLI